MAQKPVTKKAPAKRKYTSRKPKTDKPEIEIVEATLDADIEGLEFDQVVSGQFPPVHDFENESVLIGRIHKVHSVASTIKGSKKENRLMELLTKDGLRSIWESTALENIFNDFDNLQGRIVKIIFREKKKLAGRRSFKVFDVFLAKS